MAEPIGAAKFKQLFEQHKDMVLKIAYLMLGDVSKAEDVQQEVFLKVYKSGGTYDETKGSYDRWIRRITINQCMSHKNKNRIAYLSLDEMEESGYLPADSKAEFAEKTVMKQFMEQLLNSISEKYRAVLILKFFDDLPYDEIAHTLEIPIGTVKYRVSTAIATLRKRQKEWEAQHELRQTEAIKHRLS